MTTEGGGGTVPEAGLNTDVAGMGEVTGIVAADMGGAAEDLMGTVFAVRDLRREGRGAFFTSCSVGGSPSGVTDEGGGPGGGGRGLDGSGAVFWASIFSSEERVTFFVLWRIGVRGAVVAAKEAICPEREGTVGAVGPRRMVFLPAVLTPEERDTSFES